MPFEQVRKILDGDDPLSTVAKSDKLLLAMIVNEARYGLDKFGPFRNLHEGYAVLLEQVDEVWKEIKENNSDRAVEEALHVAAMAFRICQEFAAEG